MQNEWEYYNHALIPTVAPHVIPDTSWMKNKKKWKEYAGDHYPLFARWITDFDCPEETEWWHCIKDEAFDISVIPAKKRYEINKGIKYAEVRLIRPEDYAEQLAEVHCRAKLHYGDSFDYEAERAEFEKELRKGPYADNAEYVGAFFRETGKLIGYGIYEVYDDWVSQSVIKTDPEYLKYSVNAALVAFALDRYLKERTDIKYITNGSKNIFHETNYHDYLIKYFGFRKAYCHLHISYRWWVSATVHALYPFRNAIYKMHADRWLRMAGAVLKMEEIRRTSEDHKE